MALPELTPEQVRTLSLEEKDRWWRAEVYKGDMPQLTVRAAATGMLLGGVLSLTNLYVGIRTGWTLGLAWKTCCNSTPRHRIPDAQFVRVDLIPELRRAGVG